ncbi:MAG: restriction endonuclease subunit S [Patescibacteria group bacterium]
MKKLEKNEIVTTTLGEICTIEIGKTPSRGNKKYWDNEKKTNNIWLSIADLKNTNDNFVYDSKEYISDSGAKLCKKTPKGTLLMSFKLTLGRLAFAGSDLYTNEAIASIYIKDTTTIFDKYLFYYLSNINWDKLTEGDTKVKGKNIKQE